MNIFSVLAVTLVTISLKVQAWDLTCGSDKFEFQGSADEFPGWAAEDLRLGACPLTAGTYALSRTYEHCGFEVTEDGDLLQIRANLYSIPIKTVITRKRPVEFSVGCTFHKVSEVSAVTPVKAIVGQIGGLVTKQGKPMTFSMKYVSGDSENQVADDSPLQIPVGKDVEVEVSGPHLEEFDVYATVSDCFATPSADPNDPIRFSLVSKMCIQDDDVTITRDGRNQIVKFKSFAFTEKSLEMVYLHCDVFACTSLKSCGKCIKDWRSISGAWIKQWNERIRIAMVFAPNTYETLERKNLRCERNGLSFKATQEDFPLWDPTDIMIGTCPLKEDFTLKATYAECGFKIKERRHQLLLQTYITGTKPTGVISRKRPINYMLRCGYDRFDRISSEDAIQPILPPEATSVGSFTNKPDMFLNILDRTGHIMDRATMLVEMRETVVAVVGGRDVGALGMQLYAINCFVTPTEDATSIVRHNLLKDSCPVDDTFRAERFGAGQKIYFDAFEFTQVEDSQMFLHCDVTACLEIENCGVCVEDQNRRKRAAYTRIYHLSNSFRVNKAFA